MENTSENETPLFGKKPKVEEPVAAPVTATPAAPAAPAPKKTSVGLIIGAIITAAALIAASVVLVIVLINRIPSGSSDKKSDDSSKEEKPAIEPVDDDNKNEDEDEDEDVDEDKDEDEDKDVDENEDEEEEQKDEEDTDTSAQSGDYSVSINGKSFKFGKDYATTVKNALDAGYEMTYQDVNYKDHELTKSNLADYLKSEVKYGAEASIVDGNSDDVLTINGAKDYSKSGTQTVADMKFDNLYYSATMPLTLPNGKKVSCYNTTKQEVFDIYGKAEVSSLNIVRYRKDGLNISFHLDDKDTVTAVFIRID